MSVLLETTIGDIVVDLETSRVFENCKNFISLCRNKLLNNVSVIRIDSGFLAIFGEEKGCADFQLSKSDIRFLPSEKHEKLKHSRIGTVGTLNGGSSFYITLKDGPIDYLDHTIIGYVEDGIEVVKKLNSVMCDLDQKPFNPIRIRHTVYLDEDETQFDEPDSPPEIVDEIFVSVEDEEDERVITERKNEAVAAAREVELELMGDIPSADIKPPANVLFVCQLNPFTEDEDLNTVFSRFGIVKKCEILRDYKTGDSLQYAFVEYDSDEACNKAYVAMQNVLIDDKRIKVDFSQSVSKVWNQYSRKEPSKQRHEAGIRERSRDSGLRDRRDGGLQESRRDSRRDGGRIDSGRHVGHRDDERRDRGNGGLQESRRDSGRHVRNRDEDRREKSRDSGRDEGRRDRHNDKDRYTGYSKGRD